MRLYNYYRSSASYRVRIALALKGLDYDYDLVSLIRDGGQHRTTRYRSINPQMRVPSLGLDDGTVLIQSTAIIEYLEETHPEPPLLPADPVLRARIRGVSNIVACDIHPPNNSGTTAYLRRAIGASEDDVSAWYAHWIHEGFAAIETMVDPGPYTFGDSVTMADLYIVPQVANAHRFGVAIDRFPKIVAIDAACRELSAFRAAAPENQQDSEGAR